jgi:two-component system, sensor histidine kinase and response regulator
MKTTEMVNHSLQKDQEHAVNILLVDDKPENLTSLESLLNKDGENINYLLAHSGEEALKIAYKEELALILLDVQMPVMNGYEVATYLRNTSKTKFIPIIFVTAIDQGTSHEIEGFEAGAVDFLFKPLNPVIIRSKIATFVQFYLQKKELERANHFMLNLNKELEDRVNARTEELVRINKDLDNFIYTASHDLKAPISNIEGLMNIMKRKIDTQSESILLTDILPIVSMIDESVVRFKNTLLDLTEIAKIDSESKETTENVKLNFQEVLDDVKISVSDLVTGYKAHIIEDFSRAPEICYSRKNLRSIIYNLVSNAIRYSVPEKKPEIRITSQKQGSQIILSIQDNGLGIKPEDQEKIFVMFKRLHNHVEGTGVGLAIVKRIIDNSGGKIELESTPGEGTTFKIYFKQ